MNLEEDFNVAAERVMNLNQKPTNNELIKLYGMYKFIKLGNCEATIPFKFFLVDHLKVTEWYKHNNRCRDDVMREYIIFVESLINKYGVKN